MFTYERYRYRNGEKKSKFLLGNVIIVGYWVKEKRLMRRQKKTWDDLELKMDMQNGYDDKQDI